MHVDAQIDALLDNRDNQENVELEEITPDKSKNHIKMLRPNKAPGIEKIKKKLLNDNHISILTNIFNKCIKIDYFPDTWKKGQIVLF